MYLLDTNAISEVRKPRPAPQVLAWFGGVSSASLFVSVLTLGEIRNGMLELHRRAPERASVIRTWLDDLKSEFQARILPVDEAAAAVWAALSAGRSLPAVDALLMATAQSRGLILVTRDVRHPLALGVPVLNPWEA